MANHCHFMIKVKSKTKKNMKIFEEVAKNPYNYENGVNIENTSHLCRIFDFEHNDPNEEIIKEDDGRYSCLFDGVCAWSVYSCMFTGPSTYFDDFLERYGDNCMATNIPELSEDLELDIEIFSEEVGCEFMEHFVVKQGEIMIQDCVEYIEEYDEETDEYTSKGGMDWIFTI